MWTFLDIPVIICTLKILRQGYAMVGIFIFYRFRRGWQFPYLLRFYSIIIFSPTDTFTTKDDKIDSKIYFHVFSLFGVCYTAKC